MTVPKFANRTESIVDGQRVRTSGSGTPAVLIHGVGMDLTMWESTAEKMAKRFQVISYDMLGHGPSQQLPSPYSLSMYVEQLSRLLATLNVKTCGIVGFSMGSLVAQGFALARPECVDWLVSLNGVFNRTQVEREAVLARVASAEKEGAAAGLDAAIERWFTPEFRKAAPDVVEAVKRQLIANDKRAFAAAYRVFGTADAELADHLHNIKCPTLVMTGEFDQRSTPAMARDLARIISDSECIILNGQRHLTPLEIPAEIVSMIEIFLTVRGRMTS